MPIMVLCTVFYAPVAVFTKRTSDRSVVGDAALNTNNGVIKKNYIYKYANSIYEMVKPKLDSCISTINFSVVIFL